MKTLLSKSKQEQFLFDNYQVSTLHFKWGKSGMHKCTLYNKRNEVLASAGGCGYDKKGTAFGNFITEYFPNEIKRLNSDDYYGVNHFNSKTKKLQKKASKYTRTYLDGACGFSSMKDIINKIGFEMKFVKEDDWNAYYVLLPLPKKHSSRNYLK